MKCTLKEDTVSGLKDSSIDPSEGSGTVANTETEDGVEAKNHTEKIGNDAHSETETKKMESASAEEDTPVNSTSINLAALASPLSQKKPSQVSLHLLPGQAPFPTNVPLPQYQHPPPSPPMYNTTTSPQHPVQYMEILVQVPPTLLPNRQSDGGGISYGISSSSESSRWCGPGHGDSSACCNDTATSAASRIQPLSIQTPFAPSLKLEIEHLNTERNKSNNDD